MELLRKQIRQAQRRLNLQQFIGAAAWCCFGTLLLAAIAIAVGKFWPMGIDPATWTAGWIGGSLIAGLVLATIWTFWRRQSSLGAAIEIDSRFGLKERVSSAVALTDDELRSPVGEALLSDALKRLDRLNVAERFLLKFDRRVLLPLVPAVAAFAIAFFVNDREENVVAATTTANPIAQIKTSTAQLQRDLAEQRKQAKSKNLDAAEGLFQKLEEGTKQLSRANELDRKQALVKLSDLSKDVEKRREKLAADEKFKEQLNQLKDLKRGPAEKLAQALKNGNLQRAIDEIEKLKNDLAKGKLDPKAKDELADQMEQMQRNLKKMADAHRDAQRELKKEIERQVAAGQKEQAEKLQQQLDKLAQQNPQMNKLGQLGQALSKASQAMKQGQSQQAMDQLSQAAEMLAESQKSLEEMDMLNDAIDQIAQAKKSMNCKACGGGGCEHCKGNGDGDGEGQGEGEKGFGQIAGKEGKGGDGMGPGRGGWGNRPEKKTGAKFYDSNVKQNVGAGRAVITGEAEGPNRKGPVMEEIKASFESARREAADPLTGQRLPRDYRHHAKTYFDALRDGTK